MILSTKARRFITDAIHEMDNSVDLDAEMTEDDVALIVTALESKISDMENDLSYLKSILANVSDS